MIRLKHFKVQELVDRSTYERFGESSIMFLDERLLRGIDVIRGKLNASVIINTWHSGGGLQFRGFRPPTSTVGASFSQHRFGRAVDFHSSHIGILQVQEWVLANQVLLRELGFTTMENFDYTPTWVHLDMRTLPISAGLEEDKLWVVNP